MEINETTFRHSFGKIALAVLVVLFFGYLAFASGELDPFLLLAVSFGFVVILFYATGRVKISNDGITIGRLLGSKSLRWSEIARVSVRGQALRLHNFEENLTLTIDPQLEGYKDIVDIIFRKRPDLLDREEQTVMSSSWLGNIFAVGIGLFMIAMSILLAFVFKDVDRIVVLIFFAAGAFILANWFLSPKRLELVGRNLILGYLFKQVSYPAEDIDSITLERRSTRSGYVYFVQINLKSGKKIKPPISQPGNALTYQILKSWHEKNRTIAGGIRSPY